MRSLGIDRAGAEWVEHEVVDPAAATEGTFRCSRPRSFGGRLIDVAHRPGRAHLLPRASG